MELSSPTSSIKNYKGFQKLSNAFWNENKITPGNPNSIPVVSHDGLHQGLKNALTSEHDRKRTPITFKERPEPSIPGEKILDIVETIFNQFTISKPALARLRSISNSQINPEFLHLVSFSRSLDLISINILKPIIDESKKFNNQDLSNLFKKVRRECSQLASDINIKLKATREGTDKLSQEDLKMFTSKKEKIFEAVTVNKLESLFTLLKKAGKINKENTTFFNAYKRFNPKKALPESNKFLKVFGLYEFSLKDIEMLTKWSIYLSLKMMVTQKQALESKRSIKDSKLVDISIPRENLNKINIKILSNGEPAIDFGSSFLTFREFRKKEQENPGIFNKTIEEYLTK